MVVILDVIWIEYVIILVVIFWCYYGNIINFIFSWGKMYFIFVNRIYLICWINNNVCIWYICF